MIEPERDEHVAEWISLADLQSAQVAPNESKRSSGRGHRQESGLSKAFCDLGLGRDDARHATKVACRRRPIYVDGVRLGRLALWT